MVGFKGVRAPFKGREKGSWRAGHAEAARGGMLLPDLGRVPVRPELADDGRDPRVGERGREGK